MSTSADEIAKLIYGYAERIDAGDLEGVAALFEHATYRSQAGSEYRGGAAVLEVLRSMVKLYDGVPRTKHVTTNLVIETDDEKGSAQARSYYTVFQAAESLPLQPIIAGRYHDRFERAGGVWRFADRFIFIDLVGDLSQHLRIGLSQGGTR
jgi:3-phenylpropionate/cinnamic acid dioxygenase small subunit